MQLASHQITGTVAPLPTNLPAAALDRPALFPQQLVTMESDRDGDAFHAMMSHGDWRSGFSLRTSSPMHPDTVDYNTHTRTLGHVPFEAALAGAARIARQDSAITGEELGAVGLLQAADGAYYVAWGWTHDENNLTTLTPGATIETRSQQLVAMVDGTHWADLRSGS